MHYWTRRLFALAAPLLLTGCLWGPGKFASDLTLRKDGSFVLDYRGEIVLQVPKDDVSADKWSDDRAHCLPTLIGSTPVKERPCTKAEIAEQRSAFEKAAAEQAQKKRDDAEQMAKTFGLPGLDEQSNRAFAAKLTKYAGWRSVAYRGNGVFDVDYHLEGRLTQDFVFPLMPDNNIIIPFIALRRRSDGAVLVTAPALTGGMNMFGPMAQQMGGDARTPQSRAQGRFTVRTDGEIATNNSEDGSSTDPLGQQVHWDIAPGSSKIPETLIRL
jgi:hypothetical protein